MTIRVVLADDQALLRKGFRMILEAEDGMEIVGEAPEKEGAGPGGGMPDMSGMM